MRSINVGFSNKYAVVSHLAENLMHGVESRFHQYQAADGLERAYMLGQDTEAAAKFAGGLLVGRRLFGAKNTLDIGAANHISGLRLQRIELSAPIIWRVLQAHQIKPLKRYKSAQEFKRNNRPIPSDRPHDGIGGIPPAH